jgi:hypothetical protein
MIYLIGGAPRVGKSQFLQRLIIQKSMPAFSCDFLYDLDQIKNIDGFSGADILEKGRLFFPTFQQLLINVSLRTKDCAIEGEVILPEFISELAQKYNISSCFLGLSSTNIENIIQNGGYFNWPQSKLDNNLGHEIDNLVERTIERSKIIEFETQKHNLPYFDLAEDYNAKVELAIETLLS